jgi:hypothetical protein
MATEENVETLSKQSDCATPEVEAPNAPPPDFLATTLKEPNAKPARKQFVWTEKRKEAFERVRKIRAENLEKRRADKAAGIIDRKNDKKAVKATLVHEIAKYILQKGVPKQASKMDIPTTHPNEETPASASSSMEEDEECGPQEAPFEQPRNENVDTSCVAAEVPIHELVHENGIDDLESVQQDIQPVECKKRKVAFVEAVVDDPCVLPDEDLIDLLSRAHEAAEVRGLLTSLEQRRESGKVQKPDTARGFLEHSYQFSSRGHHPSQLRNSALNPNEFVWL